MITNGFTYVAFLIFFAAMIVLAEKKSKGKFFTYVPAIVLLYFGAMLLSTLGVWQNSNKEITAVYKALKDNLLPAMIFLMLLRCDLRKIVKLGPKMLIGFFAATITIMIGFIVTYMVFKGFYEPDTWKSFAALSGSWIGGTGNMIAVQGALDIPDSKLGYTLLMDSINYSIWVMFLLWAVSLAPKFNKWTKADTSVIDEIGAELSKHEEGLKKRNTVLRHNYTSWSKFIGFRSFHTIWGHASKVNFLPRNNLDNTYCYGSRSDFCHDSSCKNTRFFSAFKPYVIYHSGFNSF